MSKASIAFKKVKKEKSVAKLKKDLDRVFSIFIRRRDKGKCYTCPYKAEWKKLQNGHFCPRQHSATRYDERNCHSQCFACNMFYGGRPDAYALALQKQYGAGIIKELHDLARTDYQFTRQWLTEKIGEYKSKVEALE